MKERNHNQQVGQSETSEPVCVTQLLNVQHRNTSHSLAHVKRRRSNLESHLGSGWRPLRDALQIQ